MSRSDAIFCAKNFSDYQFLKTLGATHIVVAAAELSRLGEFRIGELQEIYLDAKKNNIDLGIECDLLPTQSQCEEFMKTWDSLNLLPHDHLSIRVLDIGLMNYFFNRGYSIIPLLEAGYHNIAAILQIKKNYHDKISHYVLSKELIFNKQRHYAHEYLGKAIELNFLAPILLFFSPRKLIGQYFSEGEGHYQAFAASQESVHKGFIVRENNWGTLFFHPKHQDLISKLQDFKNDKYIKKFIDLRLVDNQTKRLEIMQLLQNVLFTNTLDMEKCHQEILEHLPYPVTRGFFDVNKTDVLFAKLKGHHSEHQSYHRVAEVMDMIKGDGLIIKIVDGEELKLGDQLYFQSPQGNNGVLTLTRMSDLTGQDKTLAYANELVKINFMKHFPSQSTVFKIHENLIP